MPTWSGSIWSICTIERGVSATQDRPTPALGEGRWWDGLREKN
jgi:hypothetical protein